MSGKHVLITGANSGIGLAAASKFAEMNATVHLLCRSETRGADARDSIKAASGNPNVHLHVVDVSDKGSVDGFVASWLDGGQAIHAYIHNAGVLPKTRQETAEGLELAWATMLWGSYYIPQRLHTCLAAAASGPEGPARIVHVGSGGMYAVYFDLDQYNSTKGAYDGTWAYGNAKRAQALLTERQAAEWKKDGILVSCVNPGWVDTPGIRRSLPDFNSGGTLRSPEQGADSIVWLCAAPADAGPAEASGKVVLDRQVESAHTFWRDTVVNDTTKTALWELCDELTNGRGQGATSASATAEAAAAASSR